ncbi:heat shock 16 [Fusarium heterosporum]|uniref:Heat shock 16 n=1 Tax=Fusarium heterosporum TaxID=42747 RepID=A0A8H5T0D2_FUSHE|nr:heat shock 16 [Fusarium heterosporum]
MSPHQNPNPYGNNMNFWDFVQHFDPAGRGVDHQTDTSFPSFMSGFPFASPGAAGPGPHPHAHRGHGPRGPPPPPEADGFVWGPWFSGEEVPGSQTRNEQSQQAAGSESRESEDTLNVPDPEEVVPEENQCGGRPAWAGRGRGRGRGRGGPHWGRGRGGFPHGPHHGPHHGSPHGPHPPPPPPPYGAPFDFPALFRGWASHPFFRNMRDQFQENQDQNQSQDKNTTETSDSSFNPPVDVFNTEKSYVIHVALPGAKKEDIGVNWDADRSLLKVAGVVHRPGDEAFINTLASGERKVGMFERTVTLPPVGADERDEVDGLGITAKMEDGILIITVPKAEKEWTEIHKIDIE